MGRRADLENTRCGPHPSNGRPTLSQVQVPESLHCRSSGEKSWRFRLNGRYGERPRLSGRFGEETRAAADGRDLPMSLTPHSGRSSFLRFSAMATIGIAHGHPVPARKSHSGPENAPPFSVGFHHKAAIAEVGANVRSWVYTGHSQVAKRKSTVFGVNGGFSKT